jgi:hypothetical protein
MIGKALLINTFKGLVGNRLAEVIIKVLEANFNKNAAVMEVSNNLSKSDLANFKYDIQNAIASTSDELSSKISKLSQWVLLLGISQILLIVVILILLLKH